MSCRRPNVYTLDPYHQDAVDFLLRHKNLNVVLPSDPEVSKWATYADAVLVQSETRIGRVDMAIIAHLKCIVKQGVGVDNIDLQAAKGHQIKVFNTPGLNSEAVAGLAITLALCVAGRVCEIDRLIMSNNRVVRSEMLGKSLLKKTLGVIGMGAIGLEVARKWLGAMDGLLVAFDPYAPTRTWTAEVPTECWSRVNDLEDLLKTSDVVTIHVLLTPSTKGLISAVELALTKPGAILLNCARGGTSRRRRSAAGVEKWSSVRRWTGRHVVRASHTESLWPNIVVLSQGRYASSHRRFHHR